MDEKRIRSIVRSEVQSGINANASNSRFSLNSIPRHTHNNIDSPYTFQPVLTYVGLIEATGTSVLLPKGWTSVLSTGTYIITHNLSTTYGSVGTNATALYSVVTQNQDSLASIPLSSFVTEYKNEFRVQWQDPGSVVYDTSFSFILTLINNRSPGFPSYGGSLVN